MVVVVVVGVAVVVAVVVVVTIREAQARKRNGGTSEKILEAQAMRRPLISGFTTLMGISW